MSSSSGCPGAARAPSVGGSQRATTPGSSTSTRRSRTPPACASPEIFASEGERGFRARERDAVVALGPPSRGPRIDRVIATGGGAVVDPRNRWRLYRGRTRDLARRSARGTRPAAPPQPEPATARRRTGSDRGDPRAGGGTRAVLCGRPPGERARVGRHGRRRGRRRSPDRPPGGGTASSTRRRRSGGSSSATGSPDGPRRAAPVARRTARPARLGARRLGSGRRVDRRRARRGRAAARARRLPAGRGGQAAEPDRARGERAGGAPGRAVRATRRDRRRGARRQRRVPRRGLPPRASR